MQCNEMKNKYRNSLKGLTGSPWGINVDFNCVWTHNMIYIVFPVKFNYYNNLWKQEEIHINCNNSKKIRILNYVFIYNEKF